MSLVSSPSISIIGMSAVYRPRSPVDTAARFAIYCYYTSGWYPEPVGGVQVSLPSSAQKPEAWFILAGFLKIVMVALPVSWYGDMFSMLGAPHFLCWVRLILNLTPRGFGHQGGVRTTPYTLARLKATGIHMLLFDIRGAEVLYSPLCVSLKTASVTCVCSLELDLCISPQVVAT